MVNATSVGMGGEGVPVPVEILGPSQIVVDLVYHPIDTPLLRAARRRGARAIDGVGMLVHQAALAFTALDGSRCARRRDERRRPHRSRRPEPAGGEVTRGNTLRGRGAMGRNHHGTVQFAVPAMPIRTESHRRGGTPGVSEAAVALQGTLDTFALIDVFRLLASTNKTGRLRVTGDRGNGSVWFDGGGIVLAAAHNTKPSDAPVSVIFELLRQHEGSFVFEADVTTPEAGAPSDVETLIRDAEHLLIEWQEIEAVVASIDLWVSLSPELPRPEVVVDGERWKVIVATGAGATVADVGDVLGLGEIAVSKAVKEVIEIGLLTITEHCVLTRRAVEPQLAPESRTVLIDEPSEPAYEPAARAGLRARTGADHRSRAPNPSPSSSPTRSSPRSSKIRAALASIERLARHRHPRLLESRSLGPGREGSPSRRRDLDSCAERHVGRACPRRGRRAAGLE